MNRLIGVLAALLLSGAAVAAQTIGEDYRAAHAQFLYEHPAEILSDIEGEWLPLSVLAGGAREIPDAEQIEGFIEDFCGADPRRGHLIVAGGETSITITPRAQSEFDYTLHWIGGTQFLRPLDVDAYLALLGLDEVNNDTRIVTLRNWVSNVDLYRPTPDILVISAAGRAEILGRCPA